MIDRLLSLLVMTAVVGFGLFAVFCVIWFLLTIGFIVGTWLGGWFWVLCCAVLLAGAAGWVAGLILGW